MGLALTFEVVCATCGDTPHLIDTPDPGGLAARRTAHIVCPTCGDGWAVDVTMTSEEPRLPIRPLLTELNGTATAAMEQAKVSGKTWRRWIADGAIPVGAADRICTARGWHLDMIWPHPTTAVP